MKKVLLIVLALAVVCSAFAVTAAGDRRHTRFEFKDVICGDRRETKTDAPEQDKEHHEDNRPSKPEKKETPTDVETDTDADFEEQHKDVFDAILHLKEQGHRGKDIRIPLNDWLIRLVEMLVDEEGKVTFGFYVRGQEADGLQQWDMTDSAATPDDMQFIVLGDTDVDGDIGADDALNILKHNVGKRVMHHEGARFISDVNEDQAVNAVDALQVLKIVVGK